MEAVFTVIIWSLRALSAGVFPSRDWEDRPITTEPWAGLAGSPICGGYYFAWIMIAGDLDYYANYLHMPHFNSNDNICYLCKASRHDVPFTDF
eukprot:7009651-Lingulodinium_polyedra.AAC.1